MNRLCHIGFSGRQKPGKKRIIIFSNLESTIDYTQLDVVVNALKNELIELSVVSSRDLSNIEGCPPTNDTGDKEEYDKVSPTRQTNEKALLSLTTVTQGNCHSFKLVPSRARC